MEDLSARSGCAGWLRFFTGRPGQTPQPEPGTPPKGANARAQALLRELNRLSEGLLFPSESDFPLESFFWDIHSSGKLSEKDVLNQLAKPLDTPIEEIDLERLFRNVAQIREGDDEEQVRQAQQFAQLRDFLSQSLLHPQVFRLGEIEIDVFALGETRDGGYVGFTTTLIET